MPAKRFLVTLTAEERERLTRLTHSGKGSARTLTRARILLKADQADGGPAWEDARIAEALDVGHRTVERVRQRFVERGVDATLAHALQARRAPRKLDGAGEARLIAEACSAPPTGRAAWTLRLLADRLVELRVVDTIGPETVRRVLKKTTSSRT
jgi:transposase